MKDRKRHAFRAIAGPFRSSQILSALLRPASGDRDEARRRDGSRLRAAFRFQPRPARARKEQESSCKVRRWASTGGASTSGGKQFCSARGEAHDTRRHHSLGLHGLQQPPRVGLRSANLEGVNRQDGAKAISFSTWSLFLVSHLTTAAYAIVNKGDSNLAYMFLINAVGCAAILAAAALRRRHHQRKLRADALAAANVVRFKMPSAA